MLGRQVGTLSITTKITACGNRPVQGALVYAAAVPFNQFTVAPEVQIGCERLGDVELSRSSVATRPRRGSSCSPCFLRARKTGEPQGQGVSTSRLVSFKVNLHQ